MSFACGDSRDILTVDICGDTLEQVAAVELLIRRPDGFAETPDFEDFEFREGAYVTPLEGPFKRQHRFELANIQGTETIMARVALTDGCEFVSTEVAIDGKLDICVNGRDIEPTLALGDRHTCILSSNGSVRCFGNIENDKLGSDVTDIAQMVPGTMCPVPISPAVKVVAGQEHSCALLENGDVRCWGDNTAGKLGMKQSVEMLATLADPSVYPVVQLVDTAVDLAVGQDHTCAVLDGRQRLQCWGNNPSGQLGLGDREDVGDNEHPGLYEPLDLGAPILDVTLGEQYTCVLLDIDGGQIRCWGDNTLGQLGHGDGSPDAILSPPAGASVNVGAIPVSLAANYLHSCAIRSPQPPSGDPAEPVAGEVVCWGRNQDPGYLGYGNTVGYGLDVVPDVALDLPGEAVQLAVGNEFACALLADNDLRCWGRDLRGRLGVPEHNDDIVDTVAFATIDPVVAAGAGETIESVFAGRNHACVIVDTGAGRIGRCWGEGIEGQLGTGAEDNVGGLQTPLVGAVEFSL